MADEEAPKIIVDSDWKAEARKEKEQIAREVEQEPQAGAGQIPEPSLLELVEMIVMQASIGLQGYQDPQSGRGIPPNMALARHYIDLLQLLADKTRGNIDEKETTVMDGTLHELRMAFVQIAQAMTAMADGKRTQA